MRTFFALAAFLVALAGPLLAAPVPKDKPPPAIDGKYTLIATYGGTTAKGKFAAADPGDGFGPGFSSRMPARSEVTITKNEITIEPRTVSANAVTMDYTLDTTKTPIAIDVETTSVRGKKTKAPGIVDITGNRVTIALAREGGERPKTLDDAEATTIYVFQKAPPPPKVEFRIIAMTAGKEVEAEKELNKLASEGYELVSTTNPLAADGKSAPTTVHFVLKRTTKQP
jgi:uncharacterized protein (TIGR03067 family)